MLIGMGITLKEHGTPRTGTHSVGYTAIGNAVTIALLYWGGFFG
jgi:hypothetical protein